MPTSQANRPSDDRAERAEREAAVVRRLLGLLQVGDDRRACPRGSARRRRRPASAADRSAWPRRCASRRRRSGWGANRPRGSAPPAPAKLWQAVQLVRKNSPPRTISSLLASWCRRTRLLAGPRGRGRARRRTPPAPRSRRRRRPAACAGPGRRAGPSASGRYRPGSRRRRRRRRSAMGRTGPPSLVVMPSAFLPWQEAQPTRNSALPLATMSSSAYWSGRSREQRGVHRRRSAAARATAPAGRQPAAAAGREPTGDPVRDPLMSRTRASSTVSAT